MEKEKDYGKCDCGCDLKPVWFQETEYRNNIATGRKRMAVSHLFCPDCLENYTVDDSFDEPWQ